jgi:hypothetical protein
VEGAVRQAGFLGDAPGGRGGDALAGHDGARGADQLGAAADGAYRPSGPGGSNADQHQVKP